MEVAIVLRSYNLLLCNHRLMVRFEKLLEKFLKNPTSLKFGKIEKLMFKMGFWAEKAENMSHHTFRIFVKETRKESRDVPNAEYKSITMQLCLNRAFTVPVHNNDCIKYYKKVIAQIVNNLL